MRAPLHLSVDPPLSPRVITLGSSALRLRMNLIKAKVAGTSTQSAIITQCTVCFISRLHFSLPSLIRPGLQKPPHTLLSECGYA